MATLVNESMVSSPATGTFQASGGTTATGWNAGGWFNTNNNVNQWGDLEYTGTIVAPFTMKADFRMSTTSGADGQWMYFGWNTQPHTEGDSTSAGYMIFRNDFGNSIEIRYAGSTLSSISYTKDTNFDTLQVDVSFAASQYTFTVSYLGSAVISSFTDTTVRTLPGTLYGWGSRSGGTANTHDVKNLSLVDASGGSGPVAHNLTLLGVGA